MIHSAVLVSHPALKILQATGSWVKQQIVSASWSWMEQQATCERDAGCRSCDLQLNLSIFLGYRFSRGRNRTFTLKFQLRQICGDRIWWWFSSC
jgi:hypothetical protein